MLSAVVKVPLPTRMKRFQVNVPELPTTNRLKEPRELACAQANALPLLSVQAFALRLPVMSGLDQLLTPPGAEAKVDGSKMLDEGFTPIAFT